MSRQLAFLFMVTIAGCDSRDAPPRVLDASLTAKPPIDARKRRPAIGNLEAFTAGMIQIPEGEYLTGCVLGPKQKCRGRALLRARHLPEFYIDRTEVTVEAFERCVAAGKCAAPIPTEHCTADAMNWGKPERSVHPINCVKPQQAAKFCAYRRMHLPTEHQLEKASRGTDGRVYSWGDAPPDCERAVIAHSIADASEGCGKRSTWAVGSRPDGASPYGVLDLIGNVAEFATDGEGPLDPTAISDKAFHATGANAEGNYEGVNAWGGGFREPPDSLELNPWSSDTGEISPTHGFRCAYQPSFEY